MAALAAPVTSIDDAPLTPFHRRLMYRCSGGPFLDGFILSIVGVAATGMTADLKLGVTALSAVGAAALVGTYLLPQSLDKIGAGPTMLIGAGITLVGLVVCIAWAEETKDAALGTQAGHAAVPGGSPVPDVA
jgi:MFS family permease